MRIGYKPLKVTPGVESRVGVDKTTSDFVETCGYGAEAFPSREAFLAHYGDAWNLELHEALRQVLKPKRAVLSIGSGACEHDVRLFLAGYDVVGSDVAPEAFQDTVRLFPEFEAIRFDILAPELGSRFDDVDDVLLTGLLFYFDDAQVKRIFENVRAVVNPGDVVSSSCDTRQPGRLGSSMSSGFRSWSWGPMQQTGCGAGTPGMSSRPMATGDRSEKSSSSPERRGFNSVP